MSGARTSLAAALRSFWLAGSVRATLSSGEEVEEYQKL